jgi:NADPH:quinone reductase-like Zn-dependent oxidoreductase
MKAIVCTKYGTADVLELQEVETPVPKNNEVRIRIHATTVTAGDVRIRSSSFPLLVWPVARIMFGILKPRNGVLGHEFAGEIDSVGELVNRFRIGDRVFGSTGLGSGTYADYICLPENATVAIKPVNATYEEAAAVPVGGLTALHFLRKCKIQAGHKVLIHGASGSIGTYAVQIAKNMGADVTGVCGPGNLDLVRSLGADHVIDYTKGVLPDRGNRVDAVFDAVGKTSSSYYRNSLSAKGVYVSVAQGTAKERPEDLASLAELIRTMKLKPLIDKTYTFERIADAHRYVEGGHKKGNVVITVQEKNTSL